MTVECTQTTKTFALGIKEIFADWYWNSRCWALLTQEVKDSDWYNDLYALPVIETADFLTCWVDHLPGVGDTCDYGDFSVTFDMDDVLAGGLSEDALVQILEHMAKAVNNQTHIAGEAPWRDSARDPYGVVFSYWRLPAPKPVEGMPVVEHPPELSHR